MTLPPAPDRWTIEQANAERLEALAAFGFTELAEMGVADHVLESITDHLSRRMLEHYSHIRIHAKRQALDALDVQRGRVLPEVDDGDDPEIETIIETGEDPYVTVTSQFDVERVPASR